MVNKETIIALRADPDDPEDFDVSQAGVERGLAERRARLRGPQRALTKEQVTLRLDQDVIAKFRATGPGWQSRINAALRAAAIG